MVWASEQEVAGSFNRNRCGQKAKPPTNSSTVSKWISKPTKTVKRCSLSSILTRPFQDLRAIIKLNVIACVIQGLKRYLYAKRDSARWKKCWRVLAFRSHVESSDRRASRNWSNRQHRLPRKLETGTTANCGRDCGWGGRRNAGVGGIRW